MLLGPRTPTAAEVPRPPFISLGSWGQHTAPGWPVLTAEGLGGGVRVPVQAVGQRRHLPAFFPWLCPPNTLLVPRLPLREWRGCASWGWRMRMECSWLVGTLASPLDNPGAGTEVTTYFTVPESIARQSIDPFI